MYIKTLTVSQLNSYIKKIIDNDFILRNTCVKGEISNLKIHSSGHMYFSLKDEYGKISCVMFRREVSNLDFIPKDGEKVIVKGRLSLYPKEGTCQIYCEEIQRDGVGELFLEYEKLKDRLLKEGIFNEFNKKPLPKYVKKIGVVTSPTGAAIRDIINVTKRRNSKVEIIIYPSLVQGEKASENIIKGIKYLDLKTDVDVIILARGGGSIEELWAFNSENLARAIYSCNKPIISGVGHETDFTICDFVSDFRAPTPSAAAEVSTYSLYELNSNIENYKSILNYQMQEKLVNNYQHLKMVLYNLKLYSPEIYVANQYIKVENLKQSLKYIIQSKLNQEKNNLSNIHSLLNAHNPLNVLNKGYSIVEDMDNNIISSIDSIKDSMKIIMKDGTVNINIKDAKKLK